jgi:GrpB-like predicted nucleotidyltransferase (UPF0157 family)
LTQPIEIVDYHPSWPGLFEAEAALLAEALGDRVVGGIHHVGSTAVPGLGAKPIIDILVGVRDLTEARECIPLVKPLQYSYAPYPEDEMAWFCKPDPDARTHHLHLVPVGSARYRAELAFRDRLRGDPATAREYEALKRDLATRHAEDREAYTEAKAAFIAARI